jgi:hypothetical protein
MSADASWSLDSEASGLALESGINARTDFARFGQLFSTRAWRSTAGCCRPRRVVPARRCGADRAFALVRTTSISGGLRRNDGGYDFRRGTRLPVFVSPKNQVVIERNGRNTACRRGCGCGCSSY